MMMQRNTSRITITRDKQNNPKKKWQLTLQRIFFEWAKSAMMEHVRATRRVSKRPSGGGGLAEAVAQCRLRIHQKLSALAPKLKEVRGLAHICHVVVFRFFIFSYLDALLEYES